jgi:lysophospholipase L1-like esterase
MRERTVVLAVTAIVVLNSFLILTAAPPGKPSAASSVSNPTYGPIGQHAAAGSPRSAPGPWLPDPVSYSVLGDSISTAYDANGSLLNFGEQPYYSYGVGWNTTVFSLWKRLEAIYGPNSVTPHLIAVPGDKASDLVWQALDAVQNHSGFVTLLIGGNDACASSSSTPAPTPVWNFSQSLNRTFTILRSELPPSTVISLGNVVNVSQLGALFAGNLQAETVYSQTCPILDDAIGGNASAASQLAYMIKAYNKIEDQIVKVYNVTLWDINSFNFTAADVNTLDYFHPSVIGHSLLASMWWSHLPYAAMLPRMTNAVYPAATPLGTPLNLSVTAQDAVPMQLTATYKGPAMSSWATTNLTLSTGAGNNGTFGVTLPSNATSALGTLKFYLTANDTTGYSSTLPWTAPTTTYSVRVLSSTRPVILSFSAYPNLIVANTTTLLNVSATYGNPPYNYTYTGLPPGCTSADLSSLSCSPTIAGNYTISVYVNDTLGLSATAASTPLGVTRAITLSTVTVTPSVAGLFSFGTQLFTATPDCTGGTCQAGTTFAWALSNNDGNISATSGSEVTFTAGGHAGITELFVNATLNGVTVPGSATITISSLVAVAVDPSSATVVTGGTTSPFTLASVCSATCPAGTTYSWTITNSFMGSLNSSSSNSVTFTAKNSGGTVGLYVNATLKGVVKESYAIITVIALKSVVIAPSSAAVEAGGTTPSFSATPTCSGTCPVGTTFVWTLTNPSMGALSSSVGSSVTFKAGSKGGIVALYVNATLNGVTQTSSPAMITVVPLAPPHATYNVAFTETGLAAGTLWAVTFNGTTLSSINSTITFKIINGSFDYSVSPVTGYEVANPAGNIEVAGGNVAFPIAFTPTGGSGGNTTTSGSNTMIYVVVVAVAVVAAMAIVAIVVLRKKKPSAPLAMT